MNLEQNELKTQRSSMRGIIESSQWDLTPLFKTKEQLERFMSSHLRRAKNLPKAMKGNLKILNQMNLLM